MKFEEIIARAHAKNKSLAVAAKRQIKIDRVVTVDTQGDGHDCPLRRGDAPPYPCSIALAGSGQLWCKPNLNNDCPLAKHRVILEAK